MVKMSCWMFVGYMNFKMSAVKHGASHHPRRNSSGSVTIAIPSTIHPGLTPLEARCFTRSCCGISGFAVGVIMGLLRCISLLSKV